MADNPSDEKPPYDWHRLRLSLQQAAHTLPHFLKNPVEGMRHLPEWDWPTLLILQGLLAAISGCFKDVVARHYIGAVVSIFIFPIVALVVSMVLTGFFYYTFLFFFRRHIEFRTLFTHLLFASIPIFAVNILVPIMELAELVGVGATAVLLIVGFTSNFGLPLKQVRNLIFGLFLAYAAMLIYQSVSWHGTKEKYRARATPESLDILEKELKSDSD